MINAYTVFHLCVFVALMTKQINDPTKQKFYRYQRFSKARIMCKTVLVTSKVYILVCVYQSNNAQRERTEWNL